MQAQNNNSKFDTQNTEISQRILVLKRFKSLLEQQRAKFQEYLQVLEAQENSIVNEDVEKIVQHSELEQSIISEISTIQKVIDPIESMYKTFHTISPTENLSQVKHSEAEAERIKQDLKRLQTSVLAQNQKNRDKLKVHITGLRKQVSLLKTVPNKNVFANTDEPSFIDVEA